MYRTPADSAIFQGSRIPAADATQIPVLASETAIHSLRRSSHPIAEPFFQSRAIIRTRLGTNHIVGVCWKQNMAHALAAGQCIVASEAAGHINVSDISI
ncbi:hypothetical protein PpBr36_03984 [Pyricularia pennisetigena]|uniref:hypothetical protein n=1 Tax=Pyricularia pennisetigena TaxID=1578925 RepID=UPI00114FCF12|nr:hypothetical protein PpBr36_03984 [Pyricularia pennisetigena]TLS27408.1 hypothetical protein PpBr36_03984 [Pyricularia pennisetigena]